MQASVLGGEPTQRERRGADGHTYSRNRPITRPEAQDGANRGEKAHITKSFPVIYMPQHCPYSHIPRNDVDSAIVFRGPASIPRARHYTNYTHESQCQTTTFMGIGPQGPHSPVSRWVFFPACGHDRLFPARKRPQKSLLHGERLSGSIPP